MNNILGETDKPRSAKIGDIVVCWQTGVLKHQHKTIKLEPMPLAFLHFLAQHPGQLIAREQILKAVWGDRHVSDDAIRSVVKKLREALEDNARAPRYIKTVPLKGYMLIAVVSEFADETPDTVATKKKFNIKSPLWLISCLSIVIIIALLTLLFSSEPIKKIVEPYEKDLLTHLSGEETDGEYSELLQTLIFSHETHGGEASSLYRKHIPSGQVERLTFDEAGYFFPKFSPDSTQLAYIRTLGLGVETIVAKYSKKGLSALNTLTDINSDYELQSWSADGESLYFSSAHSHIDSNDISAIYRYRLADKNWQQMTFPHVKGGGDYYAKESPDGRYLGVVRNTADRRFSLLILDLIDKKIQNEKFLPFVPTKLIWAGKQNDRIAMSSYKGDLYYFNLSSGELVAQAGSHPGLNDIFYSCGERCFYMREHTINNTDVVEVPNPFTANNNIAGIHYESDLAEFHPVYNKSGDTFYFSSKEKTAVHLMRQTRGQASEILFSINARHIINQLSVHSNEHYISGKIEGRAFVFDLQKSKLVYITSQDEYVNIAGWDRSGKFLYFSRLEKGSSILLKYDVTSAQVSTVEQGIKGRYELEDGRDFVIDHQDTLYQVKTKGQRKAIIVLPQSKISSWQIQGEFLYFVEPKGTSLYIRRLNLTSGETQSEKLFENSWVAEFSLHPQSYKMLITKVLPDNSNLVKVQWHQ
jgi:DNA-binding winged helix-turn-helix (wHTH) protein/Tol biopolymer transport system component